MTQPAHRNIDVRSQILSPDCALRNAVLFAPTQKLKIPPG
jgi:hypothetical protein